MVEDTNLVKKENFYIWLENRPLIFLKVQHNFFFSIFFRNSSKNYNREKRSQSPFIFRRQRNPTFKSVVKTKLSNMTTLLKEMRIAQLSSFKKWTDFSMAPLEAIPNFSISILCNPANPMKQTGNFWCQNPLFQKQNMYVPFLSLFSK